MEIASFKALSFTYPDAGDAALKDISLTLHTGELTVICGASGSGKTTLLRCLKPALAPSGTVTGSIELFGKAASELSDREQAERIGFVGQDPESMIVTDKVWHELAFPLESLGAGNGDIRRRTAEMAEFFGMTSSFSKPVDELSGGQKQLLALASAMTVHPELLILDEPSSRLDPIAAREFFDAVSRINREFGTTVIVSEHRLGEVLPAADRLICLDGGRVVFDAAPSELGSRELPDGLAEMLPTPVRVWLSCGGEGSCPVSVSKGRSWLSQKLSGSRPEATRPENTELSDEAALRLRDIRFRYEKNSPDVLKDLSLEVRRGEFFGIIGGNGSGKSTLLSVIAGIRRQYSGKAELFGRKVMLLPQEPQSLFAHDTVADDLREVCSDEESIERTASLCGLGQLMDRHPFDLSGGELQRAAIAKLLLAQPDILLLDEPTKGMDARSRNRLADIVRRLCQSGETVIVVSHDTDLIAENCGRCAMLFDGELIGISEPCGFFSENTFYTTAAARMSRGLIDGAVTAEGIIRALGYTPPERSLPDELPPKSPDKPSGTAEKKKSSPARFAAKLITSFAFLFSAAGCMGLIPGLFEEHYMLPYILLAASVVCGALAFSDGRTVPQRKARRKVSARSAAASVIMLLLIPLTVYIGATYLNTGKYLFVSLLVMLEASAPFYLLFEGRSPKAREIAAVAVLTAAAVAGRLAFYMLPQFKPVLAVVVISGAAFGGGTGFLVGSLSMLLSNFIFGQGPWTPWQMFSMGIVGFISGLLFSRGMLPKKREVVALFGFFAAVVIYGGIVNPSTLFIMHNEVTVASVTAAYAAGLPLDIIHGAASLGFLFVLAPPLLKKLDRLRTKYEFFE